MLINHRRELDGNVKTSERQNLNTSMTVLVVECAPLIRRTIISALESALHQVVELDQSRRISEQLNEFVPDAVVIGSEIVGMSGADLAMHIRTHCDHARTPIILVSGRRSYEDVLDAVHRGVDEYIVLPFTGDRLLEKLEHALRRKATPRPAKTADVSINDLYLNP